MAVPGILYASAKLSSPDLSPETCNRWYHDIHIPDVLKTSGAHTAFRYEAFGNSTEGPWLALYPLNDLAFSQTDEFAAIPTAHEMLPGGKSVFELANFEIRHYNHVQTYEGEGGKGTEPGPATFMVAACATPLENGEDEFDSWYRKEHLYEISKCPGYRRSRRFMLADVAQLGPGAEQKNLKDMPAYIALHEFDGDELPGEQLQKTAETEWAHKVWTPAQKKEMVVWKLLKGFGDVNAAF